MKAIAGSVLLAMMVVLLGSFAQAQMEMPKPAPELKKLDYFIGTWNAEGDMKPGPMGPGGKITWKETDEWMEGNFFLIGHTQGSSPMGNSKGLAIIRYDADAKNFVYQAYDSSGMVETATGNVDGDSWTYTSDEKMGGMTMKGRYSMKILSPTSYTFKFEMSQDGTTWATVMDGKVTKAK